MNKKNLGEIQIVSSKKKCSLWAGYGNAYCVKTGDDRVLFAKVVNIVGNESSHVHQRKVKSYQVERYFYQCLSQECLLNGVNVPQMVYTSEDDDEIVILLEDFTTIGFSERCFDINATVKWLGQFHSVFWERDVTGVWEEGGYWCLWTRMDEFKSISRKWNQLKLIAHVVDRRLNGYNSNGDQNRQYQTIVHGDMKGANLCFNRDECLVYDFQYVGKGYGAKDLVMLFCSTANSINEEIENDLLNVYLKELLSQGIQISFTQLKIQYELALLDYVRFMAGWGFWGNTEYAEKRAREILDKIFSLIDDQTDDVQLYNAVETIFPF